MKDKYRKQVALLIRIMPSVYRIKEFAVHGGTAINLFHKNMPRYSFKELMASTYIAKLIFDKCRNTPNRKLISHTIKELFGWQRKAA